MEPEDKKQNKARTAITISPILWEHAKAECERRKAATGKRVSFSALVEEALLQLLLLALLGLENSQALQCSLRRTFTLPGGY